MHVFWVLVGSTARRRRCQLRLSLASRAPPALKVHILLTFVVRRALRPSICLCLRLRVRRRILLWSALRGRLRMRLATRLLRDRCACRVASVGLHLVRHVLLASDLFLLFYASTALAAFRF